MQAQSTSVFKSSLQNYALALLIFAIALGARYLLDYVVPERLPFITFFPAVLIAAYFCGIGPAILVLILSAVAGAMWGEPSGSGEVSFFIASFLLFTVLSGVNVALVHGLTTTLARLRERDRQLEVINRELKHRIRTCSRSPTRSAYKPSGPELRSTPCPNRPRPHPHQQELARSDGYPRSQG